jgi:hypothetical protein
MSIKSRIQKLEQSTTADCENHTTVIIRTGEPTPHCTRCGATLPVMILPRKLEVEEWSAMAQGLARAQT